MNDHNLQDRLEQGISGTPQLKPDEKRIYLGNFRERVYVVLNFSEVEQKVCLDQLKQILLNSPGHKLFINSQTTPETQRKLIHIAQEAHCSFTVVDTDQPENHSKLAVVYAGSQPANVASIELPKEATPANKEIPKKKSFWHQLFSSSD